MRTLKLYATGAATGNGVASVVIPSAAALKGIQVAVRVNSITDGAQVNLEVSRASAREIAVNGAQQAILEVALEGNFVTSGLAQAGINQFFPVSVPVTQGQIIYLHALVAGTVVYDATFIIWY
jgi:hypothetical protein